MSKRKNYKQANELLESVLFNDFDSNSVIDIKNKIIEYTLSNYTEEIDRNKIEFSLWLKSNSYIDWRKGENFMKIFYNEINYIKEVYGLSPRENNMLYNLPQYLMYETNLLVNEKGEPMTRIN